MAESKLKNIKALNEMLGGQHRTQTRTTVGFSDTTSAAEKNKKREVGDVWEEKDIHGNSMWFEQAQGFRIKSSTHPTVAKAMREMRAWLNSFPNCPKEACTCLKPTRIDEKFRRVMGMCEECVISMETSLKMKGQFNEYAMNKMKANATAFFQQADKEVEILKREFLNINFAGDENDINPIETWSLQDPESFLKNIDEQYKTFKEKTMERFSTTEDESSKVL